MRGRYRLIPNILIAVWLRKKKFIQGFVLQASRVLLSYPHIVLRDGPLLFWRRDRFFLRQTIFFCVVVCANLPANIFLVPWVLDHTLDKLLSWNFGRYAIYKVRKTFFLRKRAIHDPKKACCSLNLYIPCSLIHLAETNVLHLNRTRCLINEPKKARITHQYTSLFYTWAETRVLISCVVKGIFQLV